MYKPELCVSISTTKALGFIDGRYQYDHLDTLEDCFKQAVDLGFYAIDLSFGVIAYTWELDRIACEVLDILRKYKLKLNAVHIPMATTWVDLATPWENDRVEIVKYMGRFFKLFDEFKPRAFVFHPGEMYINDKNRDEGFEKLCKSAEEMANLTDAYVCVENMVGGRLFNTKQKLLDYCAKTKKAQIVLDVNHVLDTTPQDTILSVGDRIKTLHISDNDGIAERHWMPLAGKIDWMQVLSALEEIKYDGAFTYEVDVIDNLKTKGYSLKEIKDNYDKLMEMYKQYKNRNN